MSDLAYRDLMAIPLQLDDILLLFSVELEKVNWVGVQLKHLFVLALILLLVVHSLLNFRSFITFHEQALLLSVLVFNLIDDFSRSFLRTSHLFLALGRINVLKTGLFKLQCDFLVNGALKVSQ